MLMNPSKNKKRTAVCGHVEYDSIVILWNINSTMFYSYAQNATVHDSRTIKLKFPINKLLKIEIVVSNYFHEIDQIKVVKSYSMNAAVPNRMEVKSICPYFMSTGIVCFFYYGTLL